MKKRYRVDTQHGDEWHQNYWCETTAEALSKNLFMTPGRIVDTLTNEVVFERGSFYGNYVYGWKRPGTTTPVVEDYRLPMNNNSAWANVFHATGQPLPDNGDPLF